MTSIEGGELQPFDEVRQKLADELKKEEADALLGEKYDQLAELSYADPGTLQTTSEAVGVALQQSDWVPRSGASGKFAAAKIIEAAFSDDVLNAGRNSDVLELEDDNYMVLRVTNHEAESIKPLAEVSAEIRSLLEKQHTVELTQKRATELLQQLQNQGAGIAEIAVAQSLQLEADKTLSRSGNAQIDPLIVNAAFTMVRPEAGGVSFGKVQLESGDVAVIGLSAVTDGDPAALTNAQRQAERQRLAAARGQSALAGYIRQLRADSSVKITSYREPSEP